MQLPAVTATAPGASSSTVDLGPLAWVIGEVQKSLDGAIRSLRRYAREETGTPQLEAGPLRLARQQLHQAVGALQMVGQPGPALVAGAIEFAVQGFTRDPLKCTDAAVQKLERAGFAVVEFLQTLLAGKPASPVALFPQYREVLELAGNERIHPADLWSQSWRWAEVPVPRGTRALAYAPELRSRLDRDVLKVVRQNDEAAASRLHELCVGLAAGAFEGHARSFWMLAAGFFEGLALSLIPGDTYAKRAALQMLLQYATLARGQGQVAEMLARDLLFLCAQSAPGSRESAGTLRAVRAAWRIADEQPIDYTNAQFGRFDPLLLAQARKHIESAKEMWSALSGGDMSRVRQAADVFAKLGDSLQKLHPPSLPMAQALNHAVEASMRSGQPPATEFAMEVATSVLYLEAAFEDLDPHDRQLTARTVQLAGRIDRVREGGQSEALEPWMEELYHRVSDRQTMGTVVDELRGHLGELEKALDEYFRRPTEKGLLRTVPTQLLQMRGVFSVLGLDQAAQTVLRMRQDVDQIVAAEGAGAQSDFDSLGNNLGALGFLIDMLGYQPALAKRLFVFDEDTGELKPLMGRHTADSQPETGATAPAPGADSTQDTDAQIAARLAALAEPPEERLSSIEEFSRATESWVSRITGPAPLEALPDTEVTELEEDDLQDIFLQEAREVLLSAMGAVEALGADLQDASQLTVLRRAFHTLKGSSRMVGLAEFGNAGWAFEQLFNTWLADQRPATPELLIATRRALHDFGQWVQAIASGQAASWQAAPFQRVAEALGKGEPLPARTPSDAGVLAGAARQIAAETQAPAAAPSADEAPPASRLNDYRTVDFAAPFGIDTLPAHPDFDESDAPDSPTEWSGLHERGATEERVRAEPAEYDDFVATNFLDFEPSVLPPEAVPPAKLAGAEDIDFLSGRSPAAPAAPAASATSFERSAPRDFGATVPAGLEADDAAGDAGTADDEELDELAAAFRASEAGALAERDPPAAPSRPDRSAPFRPDWSTPQTDGYEPTELAGLEPRTPEPPSVLDADELIAYADIGGVPGERGFESALEFEPKAEPEPEPEPVDPFLLPATSVDALAPAEQQPSTVAEGDAPASVAGHDTDLAPEADTAGSTLSWSSVSE
ncbi:MAG: hybrid sensor histidine kinase/response regulator, partial [Comamonadaceae bacterium]